ncbi:MAG: AMP-binding protein [Proteobacteria bacterium]|nr:AMP-binding protein [Pseudomonadota bacterium]
MDLTGQTIRSLIDLHAEKNPEQTFVVYPDSGISHNWSEFRVRAQSMSLYLESMELPPNVPVTGLLGNGQAAMELFLGGMYGGFQVLLANPLAGADILAYVLEHAESTNLFVDQQHHELAQQALSQLADKPLLIPLQAESILDWQSKTRGGNFSAKTVPKAEDAALLIYTSGTTGKPKGVIHTHESLLHGGWNTMIAHELTPEDNSLCVLPLCHINAQAVSVMGTLVSGSGLVLPERFQVSKFWSWMIEEKCTWFSAVPTILSYLLNAEEDTQLITQLKKVRFGRSASAALPPALHQAFEARFGLSIVETMGITETAAPMLSNPLAPELHKLGSPGIAYGNEVRVADAEGKVASSGEESEVQVRGQNVMRGYLKNPEATRDAFTPDGWYRTGDLGKMDEDGFVFITGRLKELIIKGGENIAPREIDDVLYRHAGVLEAAAFPLPDEHYGQTVAAAIAPRPGEEVLESALRELCSAAMGGYRAPSRYYFLKELPKGPSGKIQRLKLTERFSES